MYVVICIHFASINNCENQIQFLDPIFRREKLWERVKNFAVRKCSVNSVPRISLRMAERLYFAIFFALKYHLEFWVYYLHEKKSRGFRET